MLGYDKRNCNIEITSIIIINETDKSQTFYEVVIKRKKK